ncbi:hypothetical protein HHI36_016509, partial [Cryptolaemus montrouzieri]
MDKEKKKGEKVCRPFQRVGIETQTKLNDTEQRFEVAWRRIEEFRCHVLKGMRLVESSGTSIN